MVLFLLLVFQCPPCLLYPSRLFSHNTAAKPVVQPKLVFPHPHPLPGSGPAPHLSLRLTPHHPAQGHIDNIMSLCMFNDGSDSKHQLVSPAFSPRRITTPHYRRLGEGVLALGLLLLTTQCRTQLYGPHMCQYLTGRWSTLAPTRKNLPPAPLQKNIPKIILSFHV